MEPRRPALWVVPRRARDRQIGAVALEAAARAAGLDPAAVEARPRLALHAPVRRAAALALVDLGFALSRALRACAVSPASAKAPDLAHIIAAKQAVAPLVQSRLAEVRALAVEVEAVNAEIAERMRRHLPAETATVHRWHAKRLALLDRADALGIEPGELADAIGVGANAVTRWRRIRYVQNANGSLRHIADIRDERRGRSSSASAGHAAEQASAC